jgi:hypothetical protein
MEQSANKALTILNGEVLAVKVSFAMLFPRVNQLLTIPHSKAPVYEGG